MTVSGQRHPAAEEWITLTSHWTRPGKGQQWTHPTGQSPGDRKKTAHMLCLALTTKLLTLCPASYDAWRLILNVSRFHVSCAWGASALCRPAWQRAPTGKVCRVSWWPLWIHFCCPLLSWRQKQTTWTTVDKTSADKINNFISVQLLSSDQSLLQFYLIKTPPQWNGLYYSFRDTRHPDTNVWQFWVIINWNDLFTKIKAHSFSPTRL